MWILFLILFCGVANADVYILTDQNNSVVGLSEQNDIVKPDGYKISKIKGDIANLPISGEPNLYIFDKGQFTLNATAVQKKQKDQTDAIKKQSDMDKVKTSVIGKLKALGLTDDEVGVIVK